MALAVSAFVLAPAIASYLHNVDLAAAIRAAGAALRATDPSSTPGTRSDAIEPALDTLGRCDDAASGLSIPGWWGPRAARELRDPLYSAYIARLNAWMSHAFRQEMDRRLDAISSGHGLSDVPSNVDDETPLHDAYATLKLYATLVDPKGHARDPWAAERLASVWRAMLPPADAVSSDRLALHAHNYLAALEDDSSLAWPATRPIIAVRDRLRRLDVRGIPYRRVLLAAKDAPGIRASAIFSPASLEFLASRGDVQIPGPFTAAGWDKIHAVLHSPSPLPATVERWVLDDASLPPDEASLRTQVLQAYFDEYTRRWMSFLDELKVKTPTDVPSATAELSAFKEGDGFYRTLFDTFKRNAVHDEPTHSLLDMLDAGSLLSRIPWFKSEPEAGGAATADAPSAVENSFHPLLLFAGVAGPGGAPSASGAPIDKYLAILDKLKAVLEAPPAPTPTRARRPDSVQRGQHRRRGAPRRHRGADTRPPVAHADAAGDGRRHGSQGGGSEHPVGRLEIRGVERLGSEAPGPLPVRAAHRRRRLRAVRCVLQARRAPLGLRQVAPRRPGRGERRGAVRRQARRRSDRRRTCSAA